MQRLAHSTASLEVGLHTTPCLPVRSLQTTRLIPPTGVHPGHAGEAHFSAEREARGYLSRNPRVSSGENVPNALNPVLRGSSTCSEGLGSKNYWCPHSLRPSLPSRPPLNPIPHDPYLGSGMVRQHVRPRTAVDDYAAEDRAAASTEYRVQTPPAKTDAARCATHLDVTA